MWGKPLHPKAFRIIQGPRYRQSEKDSSHPFKPIYFEAADYGVEGRLRPPLEG
jgi:hypothetical protein